MKRATKILKYFVIVICLLILILYATDNQYIFRGILLTYLKGNTTANIDDAKDFDRNILISNHPQMWEKADNYNKIQLTDTLSKELTKFETAAFIVIKDNQLLIEKYFNDYEENSQTNSFSMAKTFTTMLLGKAIEQGYIKSLDQPISDFLPEYKDNKYGKLCTVGDLSAMTSGLDWQEDYYFPLNPTAKSYYGRDIEKLMLSRDFKEKPGGHFKYLSGNTELLAIVIKKATAKSLAQYMTENFWQPMGMEHDASWSKDNPDGIEKAYCCFNATARDFAKLGQLMLQNGQWNGKQVLDSTFVKKMITPNVSHFNKGETPIYGYSVWIDTKHNPSFYAMLGHLGQRIIVIPSKNLVIVRTGRIKDNRKIDKGVLSETGIDTYYYVDEVLKMIK